MTPPDTLRHADVVARLRSLPSPLPEPPGVLVPFLVESGEQRPIPPLDAPGLRPAAVLVLLVPGEDGETRVVLIERATYDGHHSGEIAFPGGADEPGDADPVATALREAAEEVGLDPAASGVRVIGTLDPFTIPVSGYRVTPVLAIADRRPALRPDAAEVAQIVLAPLAAFLPGAPIEIVERDGLHWRLRYGAFSVAGLSVWGATARVLGQLGALVASGSD